MQLLLAQAPVIHQVLACKRLWWEWLPSLNPCSPLLPDTLEHSPQQHRHTASPGRLPFVILPSVCAHLDTTLEVQWTPPSAQNICQVPFVGFSWHSHSQQEHYWCTEVHTSTHSHTATPLLLIAGLIHTSGSGSAGLMVGRR